MNRAPASVGAFFANACTNVGRLSNALVSRFSSICNVDGVVISPTMQLLKDGRGGEDWPQGLRNLL